MKKPFTILLFSFYSLPAFINAQAPDWLWAKSAGGSNGDEAIAICTDANANAYVTGHFLSDSIIFGTDTFVNTSYDQYWDMFITKYDSSGSVKWSKWAGGLYHETGNGICTDGAGNLYVTGAFSDTTITFGSIVLHNSFEDVERIFIVKYDTAGNALWARTNEGGFGHGTSVSTDAHGNVYVAGTFSYGDLIFDSVTVGDAGGMNMFIVKYDSSGNVQWAKASVDPGSDFGHSSATDAAGNSYVTGRFQGLSIDFDTVHLTGTNVGIGDFYIVKYDSAGNVPWAKAVGTSTGWEEGRGICTDAGGNVFVTGVFGSNPVTFDTDTLTNAGAGDMFIVKYDGAGNVQWAKRAGGTGDEVGVGICTDANGNVLMTGSTASTSVSFGSITLPNTNGTEIFVAKCDSSGNVIWAKLAGGTGGDGGYGISTDATGRAYVMGLFDSPSINFGVTSITNAAAGALDLFIAKLDSSSIPTANSKADPGKGISIFPNPADDVLYLEFMRSGHETMELQITDIVGHLIYRQSLRNSIGSNQAEINISAFKPGLYTVRLASDSWTSTELVVISK
ncbi:MAG TPA: T9SS type A sorting domain-containing protein [Chitinophagales bacterium]|nr:T9SS type A sorting domain-containing protein [Chitinophagales bacterium]